MEDNEGAGQAGRFCYHVATHRWEWDDHVFRIHGYLPGEVDPTADLIMQSKHEADRDRVMQTLEDAAHTGSPFNIHYRIRGGDGLQRSVVLVGGGVRAADGSLLRLEGFYIDLTPDIAVENAEAVASAMETALEDRSVIEQAKGALMLAYGMDEAAAFAMLRWWSRNRRVKVRDVAQGLLDLFVRGTVTHEMLRSMVDTLLDDLTRAPHDGPWVHQDAD